jgi:DNA segregation ATPase FtsK/SpoIIIE-like protein
MGNVGAMGAGELLRSRLRDRPSFRLSRTGSASAFLRGLLLGMGPSSFSNPDKWSLLWRGFAQMSSFLIQTLSRRLAFGALALVLACLVTGFAQAGDTTESRADTVAAMPQAVQCKSGKFCPAGSVCLEGGGCGRNTLEKCAAGWSYDSDSGDCTPPGKIKCTGGGYCEPGQVCTPDGGCAPPLPKSVPCNVSAGDGACPRGTKCIGGNRCVDTRIMKICDSGAIVPKSTFCMESPHGTAAWLAIRIGAQSSSPAVEPPGKSEALAAETAKREAERKAAEETAAREAKDREARELAQRETQQKAEIEAEKRAKREADERAKQEAREQAKREAQEKAQRDADEKAQREAQRKADIEAKKQAQREAQEAAQRQAQEQAQKDAQRKAELEAEKQAKREAEETAQQQAKREAQEKAQREADEKAQREAQRKADIEAKKQAQREAKEAAQREAQEQAQRQADEKAQREAQRKADIDAKKQAQGEAPETPPGDQRKAKGSPKQQPHQKQSDGEEQARPGDEEGELPDAKEVARADVGTEQKPDDGGLVENNPPSPATEGASSKHVEAAQGPCGGQIVSVFENQEGSGKVQCMYIPNKCMHFTMFRVQSSKSGTITRRAGPGDTEKVCASDAKTKLTYGGWSKANW